MSELRTIAVENAPKAIGPYARESSPADSSSPPAGPSRPATMKLVSGTIAERRTASSTTSRRSSPELAAAEGRRKDDRLPDRHGLVRRDERRYAARFGDHRPARSTVQVARCRPGPGSRSRSSRSSRRLSAGALSQFPAESSRNASTHRSTSASPTSACVTRRIELPPPPGEDSHFPQAGQGVRRRAEDPGSTSAMRMFVGNAPGRATRPVFRQPLASSRAGRGPPAAGPAPPRAPRSAAAARTPACRIRPKELPHAPGLGDERLRARHGAADGARRPFEKQNHDRVQAGGERGLRDPRSRPRSRARAVQWTASPRLRARTRTPRSPDGQHGSAGEVVGVLEADDRRAGQVVDRLRPDPRLDSGDGHPAAGPATGRGRRPERAAIRPSRSGRRGSAPRR